jgi:hypothetical protein
MREEAVVNILTQKADLFHKISEVFMQTVRDDVLNPSIMQAGV